MANYDFTASLSPLDFEILSKDLIEAELGIELENFSEGPDKGIDLRYAPIRGAGTEVFNMATFGVEKTTPPELIVQCKRYSKFANLKSVLKNEELAKLRKLNPARYILTTSVSLSPPQVEEIRSILSPFVLSTGDVYGRERLNSILAKHEEIERRNIKLWIASAGVLGSMLNAGSHHISREEIERTLSAAKIYVRNKSFDEALDILKKTHVCIIAGLPGIGKTTLARMLLLYFHERKFDIVKITSDISEAHSFDYNKRPRFYYYDDFLGQTAQADKLNKNEDQRLLDFMASIRDSKDSVFVLTTREYILNQAKLQYEKLAREKFDHRTCVIDLSKYSRRIRAQILYNHLHFSDLAKEYVNALVSNRGYVKIVDHKNYNPRLIEYLTSSTWIGDVLPTDYLSMFLRKLDYPVDIWEYAFRQQLSDRARHMLFVLTTLPSESRMSDAAVAFASFHGSQCAEFGIRHSEGDFNAALKELDGTFVATRKVQDLVLVRFQNPSIRDYMQFLLLRGECLQSVISSLVFFEQAQWFLKTLDEKKPLLSSGEIMRSSSKIVEALRRLVDAQSCDIKVYDYEFMRRVYVVQANRAARIAVAASAISRYESPPGDNWIAAQIASIAESVRGGDLTVSAVVESVESLKDSGALSSESGRQLTAALKDRAMMSQTDMAEFEALATVVDAVPEVFQESELRSIRKTYADFAASHFDECDLVNPEELRGEAARIGEVGKMLKVDTRKAQRSLQVYADEIESTEESGIDSEDEQHGDWDSPEECSDGDLDSMFGTLTT